MVCRVKVPGPAGISTRKRVDRTDVNAILARLKGGEVAARAQFFDIVYGELRSMARCVLAGNSDLLGATSLVHEVYLKLFRSEAHEWVDRSHFLATAARAMRQVVVDRVRFIESDKRTGNHVPLDERHHPLGVSASNLLALDEALQRLEALDPELVQVVEMRFFAGYGIADAARILDVSSRTVVRRWEIARAWLARELTDA